MITNITMECKGMLLWWFTTVLLLIIFITAHVDQANAAISCGDAVSALAPCGGYLLGGEPTPTAGCCSAVQRLNSMANTPESRKSVCQCLKETGPSFGVRPERARGLPSQCKLNIPVGFNMDCTKV